MGRMQNDAKGTSTCSQVLRAPGKQCHVPNFHYEKIFQYFKISTFFFVVYVNPINSLIFPRQKYRKFVPLFRKLLVIRVPSEFLKIG